MQGPRKAGFGLAMPSSTSTPSPMIEGKDLAMVKEWRGTERDRVRERERGREKEKNRAGESGKTNK